MSKDWIIDYMEEQRVNREIEEYEMQEAYERGEYYNNSTNKRQKKPQQPVSKSIVSTAIPNNQTDIEILELKKQVKDLTEELLYIKKFLGLK